MSTCQSIYDRIMSRETTAAQPVAPATSMPISLLPDTALDSVDAPETGPSPHDGDIPNDAIRAVSSPKQRDDMEKKEKEAIVLEKGTSTRKFLFTGLAVLGALAAAVIAVVLLNDDGFDLPGIAQAAEKVNDADKPQSAQSARVGRSADASGRPATPFDEHIGRAGVTACKDVFPLLGLAATTASSFTVSSSWNETEPSAHAVESLVGMTFDTDALKGKGASVVYGAPVGGKCEGLFVRVVPVAQDCKSFQATLPKDSKVVADLGGTPLISLPSGLQTMLIPSAGNGCVAITTTRAAG